MATPMIETAIAQLLKNMSGITALVGTRVHVGRRPQNDTLPAIVVNLSDSGEDHDIEETEDHQTPQITVDCYAASYSGAKALAVLVRALKSQSGSVSVYGVGNALYGTLAIDSIVIDEEATIPADAIDSSDEPTFIRSVLLSVICDKN